MDTLVWHPIYATLAYLLLSPVTRQIVAVYNVLFLRYEMNRNAELKLEAAGHDLKVSTVEERKLGLLIRSKAKQLEELTSKFDMLELELNNKYDARRLELEAEHRKKLAHLDSAFKKRTEELDEKIQQQGRAYAQDMDQKRKELLLLNEHMDRHAAAMLEPLQELADLRNRPGKIITQARSEALGRAASKILEVIHTRAAARVDQAR